jgi:transcriptional regulator with XRE-family HTH domain
MKEILIDQIVSTIGSKIKMLRQQQGMSLNQTAQRAGVSVTTIHKLERSEMTPTITVLMKVADAFGEKVGFFLGEESNNSEFGYIQGAEYTPRGGGKRFRNTSGNTQVDYVAFRLKDGKLLALLTSLKSGTISGHKPQSHPGEEFVYCLSGEIRYEVDEKTYLLKKGNSLHFHANLPHRWEVTGNKGTKNLWIITPPPTGGVTELWK